MAARDPFRAVSLDLWFTSLSYRSEVERFWEEDRRRALGGILRTRSGSRLGTPDLAAAMERVEERLRARGLDRSRVDPRVVVAECAIAAGAELTVSVEEGARRVSAAGLADHPPTVNPELFEVVRALEGEGVPVVAITNTARRGDTWLEFFRSRANLRFDDVITSCEFGRPKPEPGIFFEAARRLGVAPSEILHVGDRRELDIDGARRAGCGAALYRGLWHSYPPGMHPETDPAPVDDPDLVTFDHLGEILPYLRERGPRPGSRAP